MATIVFLSGQSMGDALGAIGRSFSQTFEDLGHGLREIGLHNPNWVDELNTAIQTSSVEFVFSFVGMGADIAATTGEGKAVNFWEGLNIPFISLYGDSPAYFFDRHVLPSHLCASMYAFPEHAALRKALPNVRGLIGVSPPGPLDTVSRSSLNFKVKERARLLFLKNGNDPSQLITQWQEALPTAVFLMLMEIAGELVGKLPTSNGDDIDTRVCAYFKGRGLDIDNAVRLRLFFIAQLDDYLRRIKSNLLAKVLMEFPVDMYGHNWEHLDFAGKKINFTAGGDYTRSGSMIRESLGMIDMSPNTSLGAHERPLRAFGAYTLCLTNHQEFFANNVAHAGDFTFSFDAESIRGKVADAIAHPKRYVEIGAEAAEDFRRKYPSSRFAELLLETASTLKFANGGRPGQLQPYFAWPPSSI